MYKFFEDISQFKNTRDWLPILVGVINAEIIVYTLVYKGYMRCDFLKLWYEKFNVNATILDSCVVILGIILARFIYPFLFNKFNLVYLIGLALTIQATCDYIFYTWLNYINKGDNQMTNFLKQYVRGKGLDALLCNLSTTAIAILLASHFRIFSLNLQLILLVLAINSVPYMIYMN